MIKKNSIPTRVFTMPSLSAGAARTLQMLQHCNVEPGRLVRAMEADGAWTAEVLREAQSPLWSLPSAPKDLRDAVGVLGLRRFHQLVAVTAVAPLLRAPLPGYCMAAGDLWNHSIAVAVATREILEEKGLKPSEEAFTAAILHDVGKIVLGSVLEADADLSAAVSAGDLREVEDAERHAAGIDHAEAGAALLEHWKLPYWLVSAVRSHHDAADTSFLIADLVHVADSLLHDRVSDEASGRWDLSSRSLERALGRTMARLVGVRVSAVAAGRG